MLEPDRLIMQFGDAFLLAYVDIVLGVATCSDKLNLAVEYAKQAVDSQAMSRSKDKAREFLHKN